MLGPTPPASSPWSLYVHCKMRPLGFAQEPLEEAVLGKEQIHAAVVDYRLIETAASSPSMLEFICKFLKDLI